MSQRRSPVKTTPDMEAMLMRQAMLRSESKTIKEIAATIGASRTYVQERLAGLTQQLERQMIVPAWNIW
jgi:hypothetical protein